MPLTSLYATPGENTPLESHAGAPGAPPPSRWFGLRTVVPPMKPAGSFVLLGGVQKCTISALAFEVGAPRPAGLPMYKGGAHTQDKRGNPLFEEQTIKQLGQHVRRRVRGSRVKS